MTIRKAQRKDIDRLAELFDGYCVYYGKTSNVQKASAFLLDRLNAKDSVIFVAEGNDGILRGFTQLYPFFSSTRMARTWILNDLFVDPNARGKGISKLLIKAAQHFTKETGALTLFLETEKTNKIGNALYPTMHFKLDRAFNHYFWEAD